MIRDHFLAFDARIFGEDSFSSDALAKRLGAYDSIALGCVADDGRDFTSVVVEIQQSPNGEDWDTVAGTSVEFDAAPDAIGLGYLSYTAPLLPFIRLSVGSDNPSANVHVRVYATLRDPSD